MFQKNSDRVASTSNDETLSALTVAGQTFDNPYSPKNPYLSSYRSSPKRQKQNSSQVRMLKGLFL